MTTATRQQISEVAGLIAPAGKKGLYLGYVNIPTGIGVYFGSKIAGKVYGDYGEKATLALRYLAEKTPLGDGKNWNHEPGVSNSTSLMPSMKFKASSTDSGSHVW